MSEFKGPHFEGEIVLGTVQSRRQAGNTIDFYLSPTLSTGAAKRFLGKALRDLKHWEKLTIINTDKVPTYAAPSRRAEA